MKTVTLPFSAFPEIAWWQDGWVVASHEGDTLRFRRVTPAGVVSDLQAIALGALGGQAFPRMWADGEGSLWVAWRSSVNNETAMVGRLGGPYDPLTPAVGNNPVALGYGYVAWQDKATDHIQRLRLDDPPQDQPVDLGPKCAVGIARVNADGQVLTMDQANQMQLGVTRPSWAGDWVAAELDPAGLYLLNMVEQRGVRWVEDQQYFTPHLAQAPSGQLAVVAWGAGLPVLVTLVDPSEATTEGAIVDESDPKPDEIMSYYLGDLDEQSPLRYPHQTADGETWDVFTDRTTQLITMVLNGQSIQVTRWDRYNLTHHWDDWRQGEVGSKKEFWGYHLRQGPLLHRVMGVGTRIVNDRNRIRWYDRRTGAFMEESGLPYWTMLARRCRAYPCGAFLGMRPAIIWYYSIGVPDNWKHREENVYVRGWGLYSWKEQRYIDGQWVDRTHGLPFDRLADPSTRVPPWESPVPTTVFPLIEWPPGIEMLAAYPVRLTGDEDEVELLRITDRYNPAFLLRAVVRKGLLFVSHRNSVGEDRTGGERRLLIGPA